MSGNYDYKLVSNNISDLRLGLLCSIVFHFTCLLIVVLGFPQLLVPLEISEPVIVEIAQLSEKSQQITSSEPKLPDSTVEPEQAPKPSEPVPTPKPSEPEQPIPVPTPKPSEPEQPIPVPTPKPPKLTPANGSDNLSKMINKLRDNTKSNTSKMENSGNLSEQASMSDKDFIAAQFRKCWSFDPGSKDINNLVVQIHVLLNKDGSVTHVDIVEDPRYHSDNFYRSATDSARRAVLTCSPINLPSGKYEALKDLILRFDPRDIVR
ncbi:MAG: hypothetical protein LBS66_00530 [Rhodospirillaceae bacterium]|jgi:colicin import membrane protein|nr:hypothetical protein [Rhodospirillaceae bacterium]